MSSTRKSDVRTSAQEAADEVQRAVARVTAGLLALVFLVSVSLALSMSADVPGGRVGVGITVFVLFVASLLVGGVLGFLFGLPRSRFADKVLDKGDGDDTSKALSTGSRYVTNSNLIRVSDWLTTIVIGLGLVNLGDAVPAFRQFSAALREPLGGVPYAGALGTSVAVLGVLSGMLLVYLWVSVQGRALLEMSEVREETVPDLKGKSVNNARRILSALSLRLKVVPQEAKDDWKVIDQNFDPDLRVNESTEVEITAVPPTPAQGPDGGHGTPAATEIVVVTS
ncbi:PASTA domain-containing protein [Actinosynnema sp. NPDC049800]